MPVQPPNRRLIDEFLPHFHVSAAYGIDVAAPAFVVSEALAEADFGKPFVIRLLMSLRRGKLLKSSEGRPWRNQLQQGSFLKLAELPDKEVVLGIAGKFWRPDSGAYPIQSAQEFRDFSRPGFVKAAWNFEVAEQSSNLSRLTTETRIECFGQSARWKFRTYWFGVAPFSGVIRKVMLRQVKKEAERKFATAATQAITGQSH